MNPRSPKLRAATRGHYDIQKLRIQAGNRIVAQFKATLGYESGVKEDANDDPDAKAILKQSRAAYNTITEAVANVTKRSFKADGIISDFTEYTLVDQWVRLNEAEAQSAKHIKVAVESEPIWGAFLADVRGCGPLMAAVIISEIDIYKSRYPSSLFAYAGLDVGPDGRGRSKRKEHLVKWDYTDTDGNAAKRNGITFNPFLKTKLVGVLGSSFLKVGQGDKYADAYYNYKNRLEQHPAHVEKTKGQRANMATRYAVKLFLLDLYNAWRALESLPVEPPYHEAKLGIYHRA